MAQHKMPDGTPSSEREDVVLVEAAAFFSAALEQEEFEEVFAEFIVPTEGAGAA